jgi:hypothetical protein
MTGSSASFSASRQQFNHFDRRIVQRRFKPSQDTGSMLAKWLSAPAGTFLVLLFWRQ